ncbi:PqqD family protein [Anaerofustis sp.]|uniref:PqqD family protein n=1 Tax=Anaerofustis sp. TaxID=1872517 RepID=UPI0025BD9B9B|nr:PqqD family protein [Anaerofustis sp.]
MSKSKKKDNYLEYIPIKNPEMDYETDDKNIVTIKKEWVGFYNNIAQKFFKKPRVSDITLDEYGSFIWLKIDGEKNVYDLSKELEVHFPKMEKSLARLMKFLEILKNNEFILWKENK